MKDLVWKAWELEEESRRQKQLSEEIKLRLRMATDLGEAKGAQEKVFVPLEDRRRIDQLRGEIEGKMKELEIIYQRLLEVGSPIDIVLPDDRAQTRIVGGVPMDAIGYCSGDTCGYDSASDQECRMLTREEWEKYFGR